MTFNEMPNSNDVPMQLLAATSDSMEPKESELEDVLKDCWILKESKECVEDAQTKASQYYNYIAATGKLALWRSTFQQYNRGLLTLGSISRNGIEGELINFPVNEFRNILDHKRAMTTEQRVSFQPQPVNSDFTTGAEITLAKGILEYYNRHKGMDQICSKACENALVFSEGHVLKLWNQNLGDIAAIDSEEKKVYKNGDIQYISLDPTDIIRDIHTKRWNDNNWFIIRLFVNKYDLAVQYPDKAKKIVESGLTHDWDNTRLTITADSDSDLVASYLLIHKPTPAVPFGRQIYYVSSDCILEDGQLKYRDFPLISLVPSPTDSINFAYSLAFDLMPLQQVVDILYGAIATNNVNFSTMNILIPEQCNLGVMDIVGGMNLLKYNPQSGGKPEALALTATPKEAYEFLNLVVQRMQILAGINDTVRGVPEASLKSAAALALMSTQASKFNTTLERAYIHFVEKLGTATLHDIQDFADLPRIGLIAGKTNQAYLQEFTGKSIEHIDRVLITVGSAFAQTQAGRVQIAQDLLSTGLIKDPQEYLEVIETGSLDRLVEGQHMQLMLIKKENEILSEGGMCKALLTDDHVTHILEHNNILSDPSLRTNPSQDPNDPKVMVVQNTLNHIQEHITMLTQLGMTNPALAAILKLPVIAGAPTAAPAPQAGDAPEAPGQQPKGTAGNPAPSPNKPRGSVKGGL